MSILRENIVYTILALVAIVLIGVTIGLQLVIITGQNPTVLTGAVQQATQQALENNGQQVAFAVATVTETPAVLIIQPAPIREVQNNPVSDSQSVPMGETQNNLADEAQSNDTQAEPVEQPVVAEPTATTAPPTPPAEQPPVDTPTEVAPPTPIPPTPVPPTPVPPTATEQPQLEPTATSELVDSGAFRIGFANRGYGCSTVSEIVARIMEERLGTSAALINYDSVEEMFVAVANNEIDMTLCYLDPDDRELLRGENKRTIGFKMVQLGSQYWDNEGKKLQMWVSLPVMSELRTAERSCMLNFFYSLRFAETDLQAVDVNSWMAAHAAEIDEWANCES